MPQNPDYPELEEARSHWRWQPPAGCLAGKVILVTGAGDGIGSSASRTFASYGADVVLLGRTRSKLEAVFDWIVANTSTDPVIVPCDLAHLAQPNADALANSIMDHYQRLDGLLHNASALGPRLPIAHYPVHTWNEVFTVNVTSALLLTQSVQPLLERGDHPSVIFTSSSVGRAGRAYWGAYAASKFAVEGLMETFADETEAAGFRVNSLNPGGTRTPMRRAAYPSEDPQSVPPPENHMDLYVYLLSEYSRGVTGQRLDARTWAGPPNPA
ncbi:MAG: YciK family oxidoreductase [Proteobacteria bacterium]|nr:YciK family oxidoreductase [Pseudomonadota bacterium]